MGRSNLKRMDKGFTLLELMVALALSTVVLISACNLLINFERFSANVAKNEASLMGTALGAFEEISKRISEANEAAINPETTLNSVVYPGTCLNDGSCIQLKVDVLNTASTPGDDTVFIYWFDAGNLRRRGASGDLAAGTIIAENIESLNFLKNAILRNRITVTLNAHTHSGPANVATNTTREQLATTAIMRSRSAN